MQYVKTYAACQAVREMVYLIIDHLVQSKIKPLLVVGATGSVVTSAQLAAEFCPFLVITSANYMDWYDFAVIKLPHLFESLSKMGLVRRFDATLRLWVNTGTVKT